MSELVFTVLARNKASGVFNDVRRDSQRMGEGVKNSSKMLEAASATAHGAAKAFKVLAVGMAGTAVAAGAIAVKVGKDAVTAASNMNETMSKSATIFGKNNAAIVKWSSTAAQSLGMSQEAAVSGAAQFANFFNQIHIGGKTAATMSTKLVELSTDLASFNNADPAEVMQSFQAATRGEYDSLQKFIPTVNAASVQTMALHMAHKTSVKSLTDAEKATALYALVNRDAGKAAGDFARTSGGLANQQRILAASFQDTKTKLGTALLPGITGLASAVNTYVVPAINELIVKHGPALNALFTRVAARIGFVTKMFAQGKWGDFAAAFGTVGEKIYNIINALRGGDIGAAGGQFTSIATSGQKLAPIFAELWGRIKEIRAELPTLSDLLSVAATAIGYLADHTDELKAALPYIVGLFIAYKLAQVGANIAAAASIPIKLLEIAATWRQNAALRAHTLALNANTLALGGSLAPQRVSILQRIREQIEVWKTQAALKLEQINRRGGIQVIIAENLTRLRAVAMRIRERVVTLASAAATRISAAATTLSSVAATRAAIATAASAVAQKASVVWTNIVTAAQWAWNAALDANPIGAIILVIVALVAALIYCWTHFEGFRKVVIGAWQGIVKAATWAWENVLKPTFSAITTGVMWLWNNAIKPYLTLVMGAWKWAFQTAMDAWNNVLKPVISAIVTAVMWLWNNGIKPYLGFVVKFWIFVFDVIKGVFVNVFLPAVRGIASGALWLWNNGIKPALNFVVAAWKLAFAVMVGVWNNVLKPAIHAIAAIAKWLWENAIRPALANIKAGWSLLMSTLSAVWNNVLKPVFNAIGSAVGAVKDKFNAAISGIGTIWNKLKSLLSAPVKAVIDTVFNGGLLKAWNWIDKNILSGKYHIADIAFKGFATGGIMPGYTPGRDNSLIAVGGGEAIMRPEWTRAVGADRINAWNAAARRGGVPGVAKELGIQGFALGGIFDAVKALGSKVWAGAKTAVAGVTDFLSNPAGFLLDKLKAPLAGLANMRNSTIGKFVAGMPPPIIDKVIAKAKEFVFGPNPADATGAGTMGTGTILGMQNFALAQRGKRYLFGAVGPGTYDCSGLAGNFYAMARGLPLYHRYFVANNPSMGRTPGMMRGAGKQLTFLIGGVPGNGHITTRINGMNAEAFGGNGVPLAIGHIGTPTSYFHTPWHVPGFAAGGLTKRDPGRTTADGIFSWMLRGWPEPYLYDDGGMLQPGLTLALNKTRKPEPVGSSADAGPVEITAPIVIKLDTRTVYNGLLKLRRNMGGIWELA